VSHWPFAIISVVLCACCVWSLIRILDGAGQPVAADGLLQPETDADNYVLLFYFLSFVLSGVGSLITALYAFWRYIH
jgi:hypothetical protein